MMPTQLSYHGAAASGGIAVGPALIFDPNPPALPERATLGAALERERWQAALTEVGAQLTALRDRSAERIGAAQAAIFDGHLALLHDPMLAQAVSDRLDQGQPVERAAHEAGVELAALLRGAGDDLFAERAADLLDVVGRIVRALLALPEASLSAISTPAVVVAHDLSPSLLAGVDAGLVRGICLAGGGVTAHAAILARGLGIPAVVGLGADFLAGVSAGAMLALNGTTGEVWAHPLPETLAWLEGLALGEQQRGRKAAAGRHEPAYTEEGERVWVYANIAGLEDARRAVEEGADGVGLLRTEFLYLERAALPPEAEQIELYQQIFAALEGRPVTVRTMDLGGDKPPRFMEFPTEANPFLGWRGARIYPDEAALFKSQIRVILRAAVGYRVEVMFPMIDGVKLLRAVNRLVADVQVELASLGVEYSREVKFGCMVETPSAALLADQLARHTDFFSIGTNDLTQYTLACDRDNARVASYFEMFDPAVLRLVGATLEHGTAEGRSVSVCGELAGHGLATPVLLGLGLRKFSVAPRLVGEIKQMARSFLADECVEIAFEALGLPDGEAVRAYLARVLEAHEGV